MIPVDQTYFVGDNSGVLGNCLQAAVASVLEKPLDAVPHFVIFDNWIAALYLYLEGEKLEIHVSREDPGVESIATGESPRGVRHAVVWNNGIVHDPHPSRAGLSEHPTEFWVISPVKEEEMSEQTDRIESFRGLKDWYPGNGDVTDIAVDRAILFSKVISSSSPGVYPNAEGGISFEWSNSVGHVSIDFYPEEERSPDLLHGEVFVMSDEER